MGEEKQTRQIINKESCKKELMFDVKAAIPSLVVIVIMLAILAVIFISGAIGFTANVLKISNPKLLDILAILLCICIWGLGIGIAVGLLYAIFSFAKEIYIIKKGKFYVIEDHLVRMVEDEPERSGGKTRYNDVFYFARMGRYIVNGGSVFDYSSIDDKFYVIVYDEKKPKPRLAYNAKVYEWKE